MTWTVYKKTDLCPFGLQSEWGLSAFACLLILKEGSLQCWFSISPFFPVSFLLSLSFQSRVKGQRVLCVVPKLYVVPIVNPFEWNLWFCPIKIESPWLHMSAQLSVTTSDGPSCAYNEIDSFRVCMCSADLNFRLHEGFTYNPVLILFLSNIDW